VCNRREQEEGTEGRGGGCKEGERWAQGGGYGGIQNRWKGGKKERLLKKKKCGKGVKRKRRRGREEMQADR